MTHGHARLLFCWELGANFGHLSNLARLQVDLQRSDVELYFAVSNLQVARELLGPEARLLQAPTWPDFVHRGPRSIVTGHADILSLAGLAEPNLLAPVVDGWRTLFDLVQPSAAIIDHGPAAHLAALVAKLPVIAIGSGFTLPPLDYPTFPPLRSDLVPSISEARLLSVAHEVLRARGAETLPDTLPAAFRSHTRLPVGLPELDPYRTFRRETFYAPAGGFAAPVAPPEKKLFVYLGREMPGLAALVQVIGELDTPAVVYLRGGDSALREFLLLRGKTVLDRPGDVHNILPAVSHVLSHGGAMLAAETLAAGRPHFTLPTHFETTLNARLLTGAGYGRSLSAEEVEPALFRSRLRLFLADEELGSQTLRYGQMLAQRPLPTVATGLQRALSNILAI